MITSYKNKNQNSRREATNKYKVEAKGALIGYYDNRLQAVAIANAKEGILFQWLQLSGWSEEIRKGQYYNV